MGYEPSYFHQEDEVAAHICTASVFDDGGSTAPVFDDRGSTATVFATINCTNVQNPDTAAN